VKGADGGATASASESDAEAAAECTMQPGAGTSMTAGSLVRVHDKPRQPHVRPPSPGQCNGATVAVGPMAEASA